MKQDAVEERPFLDDVLKKLPFKRHNDQDQKLAAYFTTVLDSSQKDIQRQTGISRPTIIKIRESINELDPEEKAVLIEHLSQKAVDQLRD